MLQAKQAETEYTFQNVATSWYELKKDAVTPAYAEHIWRSLTLHVFPDLATTQISAISAPQVINLLRPLETKGSLETVKRLSQRLNEIMTYGVNSGLILPNERALRKVQELYEGRGRGSQLDSARGTAGGLLNAVTEFVDHERRARSNEYRMDSAWFGQGAQIKQRALDTALQLVT